MITVLHFCESDEKTKKKKIPLTLGKKEIIGKFKESVSRK